MNNSGRRLVEYSSDEDLSSEEIYINSKEEVFKELSNKKSEDMSEGLPLPMEIQEMFKDDSTEHNEDDPSIHGGKVRSFPHERGVWATYVFIQYDPIPEFFEMVKNLCSLCGKHGIELQIPDSFHVSLSRTVKLRQHWIQPFIESLKIHCSTFFRFKLMFQSLEVYENDEKTRTFLGLKAHIGVEHLLKLTEKIDLCLDDFQLPCFYENPSFHLSFASCVGSKSDAIEPIMADLSILFQAFVENNASFRTLWVTDIKCKSGNKLFTINLKI